MAVLRAEVCQCGVTVEVEVFEPVFQFLWCSASDVCSNHWCGADLFAEVEEFVGSEVVVLDDASPVHVYCFWSLVARSNSISPVVAVCEASSGPSDDGRFNFFECLHDVFADSADVWYIGIGAYPYSFVDAAAEVFSEVAVDVGVYGCDFFVGIDGDGVCGGEAKAGK